MDRLTLEHDQLQKNLGVDGHDYPHLLIAQVDQWETKSIEKIKQVANEVRRQLKDSLAQMKINIRESLRDMSKELEENRRLAAYTEIDLKKWMNQLDDLKEQLDKPAMIKIRFGDDEGTSTHIPLIQLHLIKEKPVPSQITETTRWSMTGQTVAGGHGQGPALDQFHQAFGFDIDDDGTLFIADMINHRIVRWKQNATQGEIVAGGKRAGNDADQLNQPLAVLIDRMNDCLIVSDYGNQRMMRWPLHPDKRTAAVGEVLIPDISSLGMALDDEGNLYASDNDKQEVRRYGRRDGREGVLVAGGNGRGVALNQFRGARNIFVDAERSVYVSDRENHRVMKWARGAREGVVVAGGQDQGSSLKQLDNPSGIYVDRVGSVYIVDQFNNRVVRWLEGATEGELVAGGNDRGSNNNQFNRPASISFDPQGNLLVADMSNHRIQRFTIQ